jgi:hypothetical protein
MAISFDMPCFMAPETSDIWASVLEMGGGFAYPTPFL